jgi:hypothetical protein
MGFVSDEPTVAEIGSAGAEKVASPVAMLSPADVRQLHRDLGEHIERLPPE